MSEWRLFGSEWRINFEKEMTPQCFKETLRNYQKALGTEFGVKELLQLVELRLKARMIEAVVDFPEFLMSEVCIAYNSDSLHCPSRALDDIAEVIDEYVQHRINTDS